MISVRKKENFLKQAYSVSLVNIPTNASTMMRIEPSSAGIMCIIFDSNELIYTFSFTAIMDTIWTAGSIVLKFEKYRAGVLFETKTHTFIKSDLTFIGGSSLSTNHKIPFNLNSADGLKILIDTTSATISAATGDISMICLFK